VARSDAVDAAVGVFISRFDDDAVQAARHADERRKRGETMRALEGIPIAIKDVITTREGVTTAQSVVLDPQWASGDAPVISRLRSAGGVITGKTTTMEFCVGLPDPSKPFPVPKNPWNLDRWAGGSSSGSASAVATGAALGAIGSDTLGSIRIPAGFCGITGLMPSFGRVSTSGCVPLAYTLDRVGPMARTARDCALLLEVFVGADEADGSAVDVSVPHYLDALSGDLTNVRVGVDRLARYGGDAADPMLECVLNQALATLEELGAQVREVELPHYDEISTATLVIAMSEALSYHLPDLQSRWHDYCPGTRMMLGSGIFYSGADYVQAQRARRVGQRALSALFEQVDVIVTPMSSAGALPLSDMDAVVRGTRSFGPVHTQYWNAMPGPVLVAPMGFTADGMPLGLQMAGRAFDEARVLQVADAFQQVTAWHLAVPPILGTPAASAPTG
jgi:aspartyl-tRNA(Asn)/glutamyl-tRNA(Gln) amidotransferase subunit A